MDKLPESVQKYASFLLGLIPLAGFGAVMMARRRRREEE